MQAEIKICPSCRGEYQPWVVECSDCGCELQHPAQLEDRPPPTSEALPPAAELYCLGVGDPWQLREVAEVLQREGVSSRVDGYPPGGALSGRGRSAREAGIGHGPRMGVYVLPADVEQAIRVYQEHLSASLPDFERYLPSEGGDAVCPACAEPIGEAAAECPACGLEFPEVSACPACHRVVEPDAQRCPSCRAELPGGER